MFNNGSVKRFIIREQANGDIFFEPVESPTKKVRVEDNPTITIEVVDDQVSCSAPSTSLVSSNCSQSMIQQSNSQCPVKIAPLIVKCSPPLSGLQIFEKIKPFVFLGANSIKSATPRTQDNLLLIFTSNQRDRDEIVNRLKNEKEFILQEPNKKKPKILVIGVLVKDKTISEIETNLLQDNYWRADQFKIIKVTKVRVTKEGKTSNLVLEIDSEIRKTLDDSNGKVLFEGNAYRIKDIFTCKQCSKCHKLGHTSQQCRSVPSCRYCSKKMHPDCPAMESVDLQFCVTCKKMGHFSTSPDCPKLKAKIKEARLNVNFDYKKIY